MANSHELFIDFNSIIRLNKSKRKSLKKSRKSLRKRIRKYFVENRPDEIRPKFKSQGSMPLDTIIEPIPRIEKDGDKEKTILYYDVDDGIYFIGEEKERKNAQTYHNWIKEAVDGHTETPPVDKNTCVRTLFSDGHNIDHPIYFQIEGDIPELAHKAKDWPVSDPKALIEWVEKKFKGKPQLRRLVRYIKAWCDLRKFKRSDKKMPSGFIMTILACENYHANDRDDIALKETLVLIESKLSKSFTCYRPTADDSEELLNKYKAHEVYFMEQLRIFIKNAKAALNEKNYKKSSEDWQKSLGDRFPCQNAKEGDEPQDQSAAYLSSVGGSSKMYGY